MTERKPKPQATVAAILNQAIRELRVRRVLSDNVPYPATSYCVWYVRDGKVTHETISATDDASRFLQLPPERGRK